MAIKQKLEELAAEENTPCVTISLNTHRMYPDNAQDKILLKNFLKEAQNRIINDFGKRPVASLLEKLSTVENDVDLSYNLDSLHIFLSNGTKEIIRSTWPVSNSGVFISETFAVRPLIKAYGRSEEYYILLLSQGGVNLYEAINDGVSGEVINDDFPFAENPYFNTNRERVSHSKRLDNLVLEFFNNVDKAVLKMHYRTGLHFVVVCTEDNYSRLMQVADNPTVYHGYVNIDYNNTATHHIVKQSWELIKELQRKRRSEAINEMKEAVAQGTVLTDLQEIYQAAIEGRGDLLIVHQNFTQAVRLTGDRTFDLVPDVEEPNTMDDITSNIVWDVLSKGGRVFFTMQEEIKDLGEIVLKTRY
ncbi:MAG TPA: hypothetical protein VKZ75_01010 [Cyclobacteriaceae bacterium]|nr:hypothetical protein [Cyclobacteriaceae bacterium]